jgi:hypothetical protein
VVAAVPGAAALKEMEVVFAGEHCEDSRRLKHYGVCENWIVQARTPSLRRAAHTTTLTLSRAAVSQVAGFVVNPLAAGRKYVDGVLVPLATADPDFDAYPGVIA